MKVRELKRQLKLYEQEYPDIDKFDVFIEILNIEDFKFKKQSDSVWKIIKDSKQREYIESVGDLGLILKKKTLTININH